MLACAANSGLPVALAAADMVPATLSAEQKEAGLEGGGGGAAVTEGRRELPGAVLGRRAVRAVGE